MEHSGAAAVLRCASRSVERQWLHVLCWGPSPSPSPPSHAALLRSCCCLFRYELLDEAMDNGYPQITDHTILTSLITQRGFKGDIADLALDLLAKVWANVCWHKLLVPCSIQQTKSTRP
jgi:hypothetical protein